MPTARNYARVVEIHKAIKRGESFTAEQMASRLNCHVRSIARLVHFMKTELGAPIEWDPREERYVYRSSTYDLPSTFISAAEVFALAFACESLLAKTPGPWSEDVVTAVGKLREGFLPEVWADHLSEVTRRVTFTPTPSRPVEDQVLQDLRTALSSCRTVEIDYYVASRDESTTRRVDPYAMTLRRGDWYLVGHCHLRSDVRTFALSRVRRMQLLDAPAFERPADFDADRYFEDTLGVGKDGPPRHVVLDFDGYEARWIRERTWHPTQVLTPLPGGAARLEMTVSTNIELEQWVLSYGHHVRVVEPPELRGRIAAELRLAAGQYADEAAGARGGDEAPSG